MTGHEAICVTSIEWRENHPSLLFSSQRGPGPSEWDRRWRAASAREEHPDKARSAPNFIELGAAEIAGGCGRLRGSCRRRGGGFGNFWRRRKHENDETPPVWVALGHSRPRVPPEPSLQSSLWRSSARSTKLSDSVALYPGLSVARSPTYFVSRSNCDKSSGQGKNRLRSPVEVRMS